MKINLFGKFQLGQPYSFYNITAAILMTGHFNLENKDLHMKVEKLLSKYQTKQGLEKLVGTIFYCLQNHLVTKISVSDI